MVDQLYSLLPTFPDVYTAFLLFLTLPITVATAESLFSKLTVDKGLSKKHYAARPAIGDWRFCR